MRRTIIFFLLSISLTSIGQKADGFFIQEFCFVDVNLIKQLKVDKLEIAVYQNNRKAGTIQVFLDSNSRMIRQIADYNDSITTTLYASTTISQFACPIIKPGYIKECESGLITKTESNGAYRITNFDDEGKVINDRWKPGNNLLEIRRQFIYTKDDLLDTAKVEDIRNDQSIDKTELHLYEYENERLVLIKQLISSSLGFQNAGSFKFRYFKCGLVQKMEGVGYYGVYKARAEFKFYVKDQQLR